jgi:hypothetical protein
MGVRQGPGQTRDGPEREEEPSEQRTARLADPGDRDDEHDERDLDRDPGEG